MAPDGTTPFFVGAGIGGNAYNFGAIAGTNYFGNYSGTKDWVKCAVIDKNYRAWAQGAYSTALQNTNSYQNKWLASTNTGPWDYGIPDFQQQLVGSWAGLVGSDAKGQYIVLLHDSVIHIGDVDVCTTPTQVVDSSLNVKSFNYTRPTGMDITQYVVNLLYFKDTEIILVGSTRGVMRVDVANEVTYDATPGGVKSGTEVHSPDGFLEDLRTPQYPNACAYYAFDPSDTSSEGRPARYVTTDAGITWTKEYYDANGTTIASRYSESMNEFATSKQILNMRYNMVSGTHSSTGNYRKTFISTGQNRTQTVNFAAEADCQYGVPYYPVGGPMNTASVIMMRSSGLRTSAVVNAGYEIQPGTVYESKTSTGNNSVSKFMVISATGMVENQTSTDPGFVTLGPGTDIDLTFPATMPSGDSPDDEFPAGATIQVEIEATNSVASDTYTSGTITPA